MKNNEQQKTYNTLDGLIRQYEHKKNKDPEIKRLLLELIEEHAKKYIKEYGTIFPELMTENKIIINIINKANKET